VNKSLHDIEAVRRSALFGDIVSYRLSCDLSGDGDESLFQRHYGPQGSFLFWGNFLHSVVSIQAFVRHLAQARAERSDRIDVVRMALQTALIEACQADEPFFRGELLEIGQVAYFHEIKKPERIKLLGRKAAEWLLASPNWQHLVPITLAAFLRGEKPAEVVAQVSKALQTRRGPKGNLTSKASEKMLEHLRSGHLTFEGLADMKQEDLAGRYGVRSRDTATKALKSALSRFAADGNADK
jgi:hypothetical protein